MGPPEGKPPDTQRSRPRFLYPRSVPQRRAPALQKQVCADSFSRAGYGF